MKTFFPFLGFILITISSYSQTKLDTTALGTKWGESALQEALSEKDEKLNVPVTLIRDKETAVSVVESILFKIYGKDLIRNEQPYKINSIQGYWILEGSMKKAESGTVVKGGTFLIIIKASNGQVIHLEHGK